jgi:hypothetical protein
MPAPSIPKRAPSRNPRAQIRNLRAQIANPRALSRTLRTPSAAIAVAIDAKPDPDPSPQRPFPAHDPSRRPVDRPAGPRQAPDAGAADLRPAARIPGPG